MADALYYKPPAVSITQNSALPASTLSGQIKKLVDSMAGYLAPQKAYTDNMTFDQYAAPNRAAFDILNKQATGDFNYFTMDPFQRQYANTAASTTMPLQGNAMDIYKRQQAATLQPFLDQQASQASQFDALTREQYNQSLSDYYASPTAFNNIATQ